MQLSLFRENFSATHVLRETALFTVTREEGESTCMSFAVLSLLTLFWFAPWKLNSSFVLYFYLYAD